MSTTQPAPAWQGRAPLADVQARNAPVNQLTAEGSRKALSALRKVAPPTESQEQSAFVAWFRAEHRNLGVPSASLLMASQAGTMLGGSGDKMRFARFAKLKREGFTPGCPDLFLSVPRTPWHGFFIEMKRQKGGTVSPEQKAMHALLAAQGYAVAVAKGDAHARALVETYLCQPEKINK